MLLKEGESLQHPESKQRLIIALYRGQVASTELDKLQSLVSDDEISQGICTTIKQT